METPINSRSVYYPGSKEEYNKVKVLYPIFRFPDYDHTFVIDSNFDRIVNATLTIFLTSPVDVPPFSEIMIKCGDFSISMDHTFIWIIEGVIWSSNSISIPLKSTILSRLIPKSLGDDIQVVIVGSNEKIERSTLELFMNDKSRVPRKKLNSICIPYVSFLRRRVHLDGNSTYIDLENKEGVIALGVIFRHSVAQSPCFATSDWSVILRLPGMNIKGEESKKGIYIFHLSPYQGISSRYSNSIIGELVTAKLDIVPSPKSGKCIVDILICCNSQVYIKKYNMTDDVLIIKKNKCIIM